MKTFIVPTDFSDTSKNAALFAAQLAAEVEGARIVLYYEFDNYLAGSDSSPLADDPEARKKIAEMALENMKAGVRENVASAEISYYTSEESSFINGLEDFIKNQNADLVIMGITDVSGIEQTLIGSSALTLVKKNVCPVMMIPPDARFNGMRNVLFATDYKEIESSTPVNSLKAVLDLFKPTVYIVNVNEENIEQTEGFATEKKALEIIFNKYNPSFYFLRETDFSSAISRFAVEKGINLIITIPKKHSFLSNLFQASHTKQLVYHSHVAVLAIPE